jgi:Ca2+-binding RTX toxin-like protein
MAYLDTNMPLNMATGFNFSNLQRGVDYTGNSTGFLVDYANGTSELFVGSGFSYDYWTGYPTGSGTVSQYGFFDPYGGLQLVVKGMALPASLILAASETSSRADDFAIVKGVLGGADTIIGSDYTDTLYGFGGNDNFTAWGGNDTVWSGLGNDYARGGYGNDRIFGETGNDRLLGEAGNDVLNGGLGNDSLSGGAGRDLFDFTARPAATNVDRITDFNVTDDTIRLDNAVMAGLGHTGVLAAGAFWKGAHAHDAGDRVIYDSAHGKLLYDGNGSAAGGEVVLATLGLKLALTHSDFVVI